MAVDVPGVVTPFFQPYDDAIEAQEAQAELESRPAESEPPAEPQSGPEEHPEDEPAHSLL